MKLQSTTEFVLHTVQTPNINEAICWEQTEARLFKIYQYALFLKQPLTLGMFVPCDLEGNVLNLTEETLEEWNLANQRVLFEGFEICDRNEKLDCVVNDDLHINTEFKNKTIEYLTKYDLTLTPSAITKIKGV